MEIHPDLSELRFLLGVWRGTGDGRYPTIDDFSYWEEAAFSAGPGKPFILYTQRTKDAISGHPLHVETGYIRPAGPGRAELVLVQPTGIVEVHTGAVSTTHVHFRAGVVESTPTAKDVTDVERHIEVEGDQLKYRLSMAAVGQPLETHLEARLVRQIPSPWDRPSQSNG